MTDAEIEKARVQLEEESCNSLRYRKEIKSLGTIFLLANDKSLVDLVMNSQDMQTMFKEYDSMGYNLRNFMEGESLVERNIYESFVLSCAQFSYALNMNILEFIKNEDMRSKNRTYKHITYEELKGYFCMTTKAEDIILKNDVKENCCDDSSFEIRMKHCKIRKDIGIDTLKESLNKPVCGNGTCGV